MTRTLRLAAAAAVSLALAPAAIAAPPAWQVDKAASRIAFSGTHAGNKFDGVFGDWNAQIRFDPKDLASAKVVVVIGTASARTGDKFRDTTLTGEEWFNPAKFPRATFTSQAIRAANQPNRYVVEGVLNLKGKNIPVRLPFALAMNGNTATVNGSVTLDRIALGLGTVSDPKAAWVSREIPVTITLKATRGK